MFWTVHYAQWTNFVQLVKNIDGHGFWDKGGCTPGGVSKKIFRPPSAAEKFLRRPLHRGVKIFFRWVVYLVDPGVILPKNGKKLPHQGVKIFFPPGASHPGVHPPLFFSRRVSGNFWS